MHGYGAEMVSATEILGHPTTPQQQPTQQQQQQQQPQQQQQQQQQLNDSKFDMSHFDESVHSDSYVSYLESDDSMTAPLGSTTSP